MRTFGCDNSGSDPERAGDTVGDTLNQDTRFLITARFHGGVGGAERAVYCLLQALYPNPVDVVVKKRFGGPWATIPAGVRVFTRNHWRWVGAASASGWRRMVSDHLLNPVRMRFSAGYDVHLALAGGPEVTRASRARVRLFNTAGSKTVVPGTWDLYALEAPDNIAMIPSGSPSVLLPPPYLPLAATASSPGVSLPSSYLLTVFNPYWAVKGLDDLLLVADSAPWPIVWCHSNQTVGFDIPSEFGRHPNIVHVTDASPEELRFLYEACIAYVSFSRSEGFGWAIADAFALSRAIVSRAVGVLSFPEAKQEGVFLVEGAEWVFDWNKLEHQVLAGGRSMTWLSVEAFRTRIANTLISRDRSGNTPAVVYGSPTGGSAVQERYL